MAYTKTTWTDNVTPVSAANMNKIEQGVYDAQDGAYEKALLTATGSIMYASGPNTPAMLALGTTGQCHVSNGTTIVNGYPDSPTYVASNNVILTANTERSVAGTTYQVLKQFTVKYTGVVRLKFDMHGNGEQAYVAVGAQYGDIPTSNITSTSAGQSTYITVTPIDVNVVGGVTYYLYGRVLAGGYACYVRNFTVSADKSTNAVVNSIVD